MKRNTLRLLALALALVLCMSMFLACDDGGTLPPDPFEGMTEAERAFELIRLYCEKQEALTSGTISLTLTGSFQTLISDVSCACTFFANGSSKVAGLGTENLSYIEEFTNNITITPPTGSAITQVGTTKEGFQNGKMFEETTKDGKTEKFASAITAAEYAAYMEKYDGADLIATASNCTMATSAKQADGSWLLTFTGFTSDFVSMADKEFLAEISELFVPGQVLSDVRLAYIIAADYTPIQMTVEFVFANEDPTATTALPVLTQTQIYSGMNATTIETLDLTGFVDIGDLRQFTIYREALSERVNATTGRFTALQKTDVVITGGQSDSQSKTYTGSFTNLNGFTYTITGTQTENGSSQDFSLSYANGVCTENNQTSTSTDEVEKEGLKTLLDPAGVLFGMELERVMVGTTPNTYVFTTDGIAQPIAQQLLSQMAGASIMRQSEALTVTYDPVTGALVSSEVRAQIKILYYSKDITATVVLSCTYQ